MCTELSESSTFFYFLFLSAKDSLFINYCISKCLMGNCEITRWCMKIKEKCRLAKIRLIKWITSSRNHQANFKNKSGNRLTLYSSCSIDTLLPVTWFECLLRFVCDVFYNFFCIYVSWPPRAEGKHGEERRDDKRRDDKEIFKRFPLILPEKCMVQ